MNSTKINVPNYRRVLNVVCSLLGNSPAYEFYMPTFRNTLFQLHRNTLFQLHRNTLFQLHRQVSVHLPAYEDESAPKRRHIKFRRRGITQKIAYYILLYLHPAVTLGRQTGFHNSWSVCPGVGKCWSEMQRRSPAFPVTDKSDVEPTAAER